MFITNSPAPSRINSAELPQRDVTVWEFAIFGYFPCIIRTVRTRSFNHKHKHRKMAIFCYFFSRFFFCSLNWEFSYSNWEKNILFGIGNTTEYRSSKRAKKNPWTGAHNFFRLNTPVICDYPQLRGMSRTLTLCLQFPIETTILQGQLAGKTMTVLPRSLFLYCSAMFV